MTPRAELVSSQERYKCGYDVNLLPLSRFPHLSLVQVRARFQVLFQNL